MSNRKLTLINIYNFVVHVILFGTVDHFVVFYSGVYILFKNSQSIDCSAILIDPAEFDLCIYDFFLQFFPSLMIILVMELYK